MNTTPPIATASTVAAGEQASDAGHTRADPQQRGSTILADQVVARMAAAAASEVAHVGGSRRRLLGMPAGREETDRPPEVHARVHGSVATITMRLSVAYPASVATVTEAVRAQVIDRLAALAGITVGTVEITVTALVAPQNQGRVIA